MNVNINGAHSRNAALFVGRDSSRGTASIDSVIRIIAKV
jgi:hypothetical protein